MARIKKEMNTIVVSEGYADSTKTMGEIIQKLNKEPRFLFPNTDNARQMILDEYDRILSEINTQTQLAAQSGGADAVAVLTEIFKAMSQLIVEIALFSQELIENRKLV